MLNSTAAPVLDVTGRSEAVGTRPGSSTCRLPAPAPLVGRWTTLDPLSIRHIAPLQQQALSAAGSWTWLHVGPFADADLFAAYIRMACVSEGEMIWTVRPHDADGHAGPPAGWLALLDVQPRHAALELGNVWFPPGLARTRSATEAAALLIGYAFDLGYRRVAWKCDVQNEASRRAAERLGFRPEGVARAHMIVRGQRRDTSWYSMLDEEWPQRRSALADWLDPRNFDPAGRALSRLRRAA